MTSNRLGCRVFSLAAMLVLGCSGTGPTWPVEQLPLVPAAGTVTLDRRPLAEASLLFYPLDEPQRWPSVAVTDAEGSFRLSTYGREDGAPPGSYKVTVSWKGPRGSLSAEDYDSLPQKLPSRYQSPDKSGLRADIYDGASQLSPLELTTR